jgi:cyclophilin family peptidyl-prolyl cis-trans isomerase
MLKRLLLSLVLLTGPALGAYAQQKSPGAGPIVVLETSKGTIEFETYPEEAPKTVARVLDLVKKNFYNGQRFHRAEPKFLVQIGDPVSRDMSREEWWGRQGTGKPIGVAEVTRKRAPVLGAVGMAYPGTDKLAADSQFFILRRNAPELQGKYTIFGKVLTGMDVVQKLQRGDMLKRAYLKQ